MMNIVYGDDDDIYYYLNYEGALIKYFLIVILS